MKFALTAATAVAVTLGAAAATKPAAAFEIPGAGLTVTATPAIASDYVFRGVSQTRGRPAMQMGLDIEHESGFYIGGFISNVSFAGTDARQEVDGLAGYRFGFAGLKVDLGAIYYGYPGYDKPTGGVDLDYYEFAAKVSYEIAPVKLLGAYYFTPDYTGELGNGHYAEAGVDLTLPADFTLSGRYGYQWINDKVGGRDISYGNYSVAVSHPIFSAFTLSAGYYGTTYDKNDAVTYKYVEPRFMVMLSGTF